MRDLTETERVSGLSVAQLTIKTERLILTYSLSVFLPIVAIFLIALTTTFFNAWYLRCSPVQISCTSSDGVRVSTQVNYKNLLGELSSRVSRIA